MGLTPFYAHDDAGSQKDRRLLLISFHFPPDTAVGARRWEKLAHFAVERGWGLDVVMQRVAGQPTSSARMQALPRGVRVFAVPLRELALERMEQLVWQTIKGSGQDRVDGNVAPAVTTAKPAPTTSIARPDVRWALHTPRGVLRAYWSWLDYASMGAWARDAARAGKEIFIPGVHRAVITSGPPFMVHDAGRRIAMGTNAPFVMDMRDPWRHVERLSEKTASPLWPRIAALHEGRAVRQASLIVANTERAREQLAATYPSRADDIITVTNGADDDPLPPPRRGARFVIAHAGTVYLDRDPRALFEAASRVIRELALSPDEFGLSFIGDLEAVGGFPIHEVARQEGISDYVQTGPLLPQSAALDFMAGATMLVTMSGTNMAAVPAKTFECARFPAWLLALSAPGSATEVLLRGTGADVVAPSDVDGIAAVIRRHYREHRDGVIPAPAGAAPRFSRRHQADILFDALVARLNSVDAAATNCCANATGAFSSTAKLI